jgi:hypothetical protein
MEKLNELKKVNYDTKNCVQTEGCVVIFDPDSQKEVVGAEKMTYDEYLDVQIASLGKLRREFVNLYFNIPMGFKGEIEKVNKDKVCFKRIFTLGMFFDGGMFDGKEDHVWMDKKGFEKYKVGDSVEFFAEVYRYVKTGNGKQIDFVTETKKDIGAFLTEEKNKVVIKVKSSLRNLMGPHHFEPCAELTSVAPYHFTLRGSWKDGLSPRYTHTYNVVPFGVDKILLKERN